MHKNVEFDADFKTKGKVAEMFRRKKMWKSFRFFYFLNELSCNLETSLKSEGNLEFFDTVIDFIKKIFIVGIKTLLCEL